MDLLNYTVTAGSRGNVQLPRYTISCLCVDSSNQSIVLADLTGANAIQFPAVIDTLTATQQRQILDFVIDYIIQIKAGITV
jgi:hypothetical protein